ncbi:hypothetical protein JI735_33085 [Paenibacillus sonchi]|uniref:Uncharacterized protein n=1 Tax=Paenibacillus sonchi TaxID=373687 RepID=A0A974PCU3_9BACL|nr:hypothetical protein [Paenibacillus sonchi]QQZ61161.1 hypothetical protein JI735_33085 [Paenibacillus sonchi]
MKRKIWAFTGGIVIVGLIVTWAAWPHQDSSQIPESTNTVSAVDPSNINIPEIEPSPTTSSQNPSPSSSPSLLPKLPLSLPYLKLLYFSRKRDRRILKYLLPNLQKHKNLPSRLSQKLRHLQNLNLLLLLQLMRKRQLNQINKRMNPKLEPKIMMGRYTFLALDGLRTKETIRGTPVNQMAIGTNR